jgi:PAS domain S-box-containing protein
MGKPLRVLFVEDSEDDVKILLLELRKGGYDPIYKRVQTAEDLRESLLYGEWEIVISDYRMPGFSGMDAHAILKESGCDLPFILVSGTIGEEAAVEAMRAGAHDYVMKDNLKRLLPAVQRELQEVVERRSRRQAEAALRESEERFRAMADSAPVLMWVSEADGSYSYVNKPWLEFTGRALDQELGSGWRDRIHTDDIRDAEQRFKQNFALQRPFQIEYRLQRRDKDWRWVLDTATPRFHPDGAFAGYIGTVVDLTDRKRAEMERESVRAENERLLAEKATAMLAQRAFLKDILFSVTEGKLVLCDSAHELPMPLAFGGEIPISEQSLSEIRQTSREAADSLDLPADRMHDLITAVGEASMNAVVHGGGGEARVCAGPDRVQVWIEDHGKGIAMDRLPKAMLERGYTTANSLGHGFFLMLSLIDRLHLLTGPTGTTIVLEQYFSEPEPIWLQGVPMEHRAA